MTRNVTKEQHWPTPTTKMPCPVCENEIVVNIGMLLTEALQKFGPLTQEDLERTTAHMAHFRFCLGSEYERGE